MLTLAKAKAPLAWLRQCGRALPLHKRFSDRKGLLLDFLSRAFRTRARELGVRTNSAFAGTYDFAAAADYAKLVSDFSRTGCRITAWSCAIPGMSTTSSSVSTR